MPARVVEGANLAVLAAGDDDRVMAERPGDPVAGLRDQAGVPGIKPMAPPDALHVGVEDDRRRIERSRQWAGAAIAMAKGFDPLGIVVVDTGGHRRLVMPARAANRSSRW